MEGAFAEMEQMEADEVFGPREDEAQRNGQDDGMTLTADPPRTSAECR